MEIKTSITKSMNDVIRKSFQNNQKKIIFEFGSRYGEDTIALAKEFPDAEIYTFECNPNTIEDCRKNCSRYKNIHLTEKAISNECKTVKSYPINKEETITHWHDGNQGASSLLKSTGKYELETYRQDEIEVEAITLEYFMETHNIDHIDFLWMDIQGGELMALEGLGHFLQKVNVIYTEVEFVDVYENQPLYNNIRSFLVKNGFSFAKFKTVGEYDANAFFVNSSNKELLEYIRNKDFAEISKSLLLLTKIITKSIIGEKYYNKLKTIKNKLTHK